VDFIRKFVTLANFLVWMVLSVSRFGAADSSEAGLPEAGLPALTGTWTGKSAEDGETYIFTFRPDGVLELEELLPDGKIHKDTAEYEADGDSIRVRFLTGFFAGEEGFRYSYTLEGDRLTLTANVENTNAETVVFERKRSEDVIR
jgi:hypothetical protein